MPKGFHMGRTQSRHYTCEYYRIPALVFKNLLELPLGKYQLTCDSLDKEHRMFNLIKTERWERVLIFSIKEQKIPIPLSIDNRSASKKLYLVCPYCSHQRQHLYAVTNAYACRKCLNLQYACQSERQEQRLIRRVRKLRAILWTSEACNSEFTSLLEGSEWRSKPKWMRWNKFNRELDKIIVLEKKYKQLQERFIDQYLAMGIEW